MGLMNFVRNRKAVSASRASINGIAGHAAASKAMGRSLGFSPTWSGTTPSGRIRGEMSAVPNNSNQDFNNKNGVIQTGQGHVNVIPAGSKPLTAKNSDWGDLPKY